MYSKMIGVSIVCVMTKVNSIIHEKVAFWDVLRVLLCSQEVWAESPSAQRRLLLTAKAVEAGEDILWGNNTNQLLCD